MFARMICLISNVSLIALVTVAAGQTGTAQTAGELKLRAQLSGNVGTTAVSGRSDFSDKGSNRRSLKVTISNLPLPQNTRLGISVNGIGPQGFFSVVNAKAEFFAQTNPADPILGDPVPVLHAGDTITIHLVPVGSVLGTAIMHGTFQ